MSGDRMGSGPNEKQPFPDLKLVFDEQHYFKGLFCLFVVEEKELFLKFSIMKIDLTEFL